MSINQPSVQTIIHDLDTLISQPIWSISQGALEAYKQDYFDARCQKSKAAHSRASSVIPGGVQHNLAFNYPFPLEFTKAQGPYLWDVDGNRYFDFLQAGGPTVLGSNPDSVREHVLELINDCGPSTGLFHEYEYKLAQLICDLIPHVDMFRMLGSGTEACMAAVRVARLATGKKHVLKMGGAYHGWSDSLAYGIRVPGSKWTQAHGIPRAYFAYTDEFFPGSLEDLEHKLKMKKLRGGTAAVMLEPIGPESGTRPITQEFLEGAQELCRKYGALLIFDEVVTAFRLSEHGAQGYFGVSPDLTVFGKVIAGGYPGAGGLGGKRTYMKYLGAGLSDGEIKIHKALVGGTMSANPLSCVAGYWAVKEIAETGACQKAGQMGDRITRGLRELIKKYDLPFVAWNQESVCHLETVGTMHFSIDWHRPWKIPHVLKETTARKKEMEHVGAAYMAEGLVTLAGSRLYTSAAYNPELIDEALTRFERVFQHMEPLPQSSEAARESSRRERRHQ